MATLSYPPQSFAQKGFTGMPQGTQVITAPQRSMVPQYMSASAPQRAFTPQMIGIQSYGPQSGSLSVPVGPLGSMTSGSYVPPVVSGPSGRCGIICAAPAAAVRMGVPASGSYAPFPVGTNVLSGSYVPPMSGSYTAPPMVAASGSYAPPISGSYAPPVAVVQSGSYCAPASGGMMMMRPPASPMMMPVGGSVFPEARELPDPATVEAQQRAYKQALEKQFLQALAQIEGQREATKQMLRQSAQQQKDQFAFQANSKLEAKKLELDTQLHQQLMMLQEAAMQHRKFLEEKAAGLTLDFQQRKYSEDLIMKQYMIQKQFIENERRLEEDFQQKQQRSSPAKVAE